MIAHGVGHLPLDDDIKVLALLALDNDPLILGKCDLASSEEKVGADWVEAGYESVGGLGERAWMSGELEWWVGWDSGRRHLLKDVNHAVALILGQRLEQLHFF